MKIKKKFWEIKNLSDMTRNEWDSLCDGCGKCCLHKMENEENNIISYTNIACRLLNVISCQCNNYKERTNLVEDCVELTKDNLNEIKWLPQSCAYRLLSEGKDLYWWHPLISGDKNTVHAAGVSVKGRTVSEQDADDFEEHIVSWPGED